MHDVQKSSFCIYIGYLCQQLSEFCTIMQFYLWPKILSFYVWTCICLQCSFNKIYNILKWLVSKRWITLIVWLLSYIKDIKVQLFVPMCKVPPFPKFVYMAPLKVFWYLSISYSIKIFLEMINKPWNHPVLLPPQNRVLHLFRFNEKSCTSCISACVLLSFLIPAGLPELLCRVCSDATSAVSTSGAVL